MEYTRLGNTGAEVSRICLGCMSFGDNSKGITGKGWAIDEQSSRAVIKRALELGINYFDTANVYSAGTSEEFVGRALKDMANRNEIVLATKVHFPTGEGRNCRGLSRKEILYEVDPEPEAAGHRLYRPVYHSPLGPDTPIEETMDALNDVVKSGKVLYLGASSMGAWQFAKAQHAAEKHGWTKFVTMQNLYNLIYREEERDMIPLCRDMGVGLTPGAPTPRAGWSASPVQSPGATTTRRWVSAFFRWRISPIWRLSAGWRSWPENGACR